MRVSGGFFLTSVRFSVTDMSRTYCRQYVLCLMMTGGSGIHAHAWTHVGFTFFQRMSLQSSSITSHQSLRGYWATVADTCTATCLIDVHTHACMPWQQRNALLFTGDNADPTPVRTQHNESDDCRWDTSSYEHLYISFRRLCLLIGRRCLFRARIYQREYKPYIPSVYMKHDARNETRLRASGACMRTTYSILCCEWK